MSKSVEDGSLITEDDVERLEDDGQLAAMRQMMGFSSFGGPQKPKRQPRVPGLGKGFGTGANTQPIQPRNSSVSMTTTSTLSATSHPFVPASLPPRPPKQVSDSSPALSVPPVPKAIPTDPSSPSPAFDTASTTTQTEEAKSQFSHPINTTYGSSVDSNFDEIAYINSTTGYALTKRELMAYERGVMEQVVNGDGTLSQVKVYFKPNFVEDNPWEQLEVKAGLKKAENKSEFASTG